MHAEPFRWLGDYNGFQVTQSCLVKPNKTVTAHKTILAPADMGVRCKLYWSPAFCLLLSAKLEFGRLVQATAQLIKACPVIAGR